LTESDRRDVTTWTTTDNDGFCVLSHALPRFRLSATGGTL
jgi:hypothetical protein